MSAARVISYDFRANFSNLKAGLTTAGASVNDFGTKLTALDKNGAKMRAGLTAIGATAGKVGLAAAAGLGAIVLVTAKFDKAMSNVAATGEDARDSLDELRQAAIDAGADTAFSASEAAAGIENLLKAGISARDVLGGGLAGALDLAAAGELDVAQAAEIAATAMTQFSLGGEDVSHVADLLAAGAGKAQGDVTDMGMALKQSGLVASQVGLTIEETTGTLAAFASAGLIGSDAGTSFKTMLQSLTPTGDKARETMEELGISAYDAQGNFVGMTEFAASLQAGLKDLSVEQQNAAMKTIFGSDAVRAASVIFDQGADGVQKWIDNVNDSGYAAEVAGQRLDNLAGDWEALTGSIETALIGSGEGSTGIIREMVQGATALTNAFNDLPPAAKNVSTGLLAITAITGGALWFGSKVVGGVVATNAALAQLGITAQLTAGSLRATAGAFSVLALGAGYALDSMSIVDSMGRSKDAADSYSTSVLSLAAALQESNVGKYANDLGINVQLLAEDLYANGEAGEYVSQVLSELEETGRGFDAWAKSAAGTVVPFWTDSASKAYDAGKDLDSIIGNIGASFATLPDSIPDDSMWAAFYAGADATDDYASAASGSAAATKEEAQALRDSVKAMREKTSATLAAFDAETQYRQALKAARQQGDKTNAGIRGNSDAALENRGVISALASAWNNQSAAVKNNGQRFKEARSDFIETATAMGVPEKAAKRLADQILDIPKSRAIKITAETAAAQAAAAELKRRIDEATRDRVVTVRINRLGDMGIGGGRINNGGAADGGTVPKTGLPYADRHIYMLADGEEIISNRYGQADDYRAKMGIPPARRLADGGTAGGNARGGGDGSAREYHGSVKSLTRALKEAEKALDRETRQRDNLISKRDDLAAGIRGGLDRDIWAGASNPWAAGATSNPTDALREQTAEAREFTRLVRSLKSKGLDGGALAEVIGSGDLERARLMASLPARALRQFEQAFNTNQRAMQAAGATGGNAVYGQQVAAQTQEIKGLRADVRAVQHAIKEADKSNRHGQRDNARDVSKGISGAASRGMRSRRNG